MPALSPSNIGLVQIDEIVIITSSFTENRLDCWIKIPNIGLLEIPLNAKKTSICIELLSSSPVYIYSYTFCPVFKFC